MELTGEERAAAERTLAEVLDLARSLDELGVDGVAPLTAPPLPDASPGGTPVGEALTGPASLLPVWGVAEARRALAAGVLSSVDLTAGVLKRIEQLNPELNAYLHVDAEGALAQARAADAGELDGPLRGIPICVKDVIDVAGMPTTAGAAGWRRDPDRDATVVARLRAAGAVIVGKGHTNEFAYGADGRNPHRGDCRNPHDPALITGGSSSGPAVAAQTGMALGAIGTDTSGSIRIPASLCGVVGLRPTHGLIPVDGVLPLSWSYDTVGPLTRTVEDAALLWSVIAGVPPPGEPARGPLRIGVAEQLLEVASAEVAAGVRRAAAALGGEVVPVRFDLLRYALPMHRVIQLVEAAQAHAPWFDAQRRRYAEPVRDLLAAGYLMPATRYLRAQQARRLFLEDVTRALDGIDVLLAPSTPTVATRRDADEIEIDGRSWQLRAALLSCTIPTTQLGWPALSVPIGTVGGLPYGVQIAGRPLSEPLLLRVGATLERDRAAA